MENIIQWVKSKSNQLQLCYRSKQYNIFNTSQHNPNAFLHGMQQKWNSFLSWFTCQSNNPTVTTLKLKLPNKNMCIIFCYYNWLGNISKFSWRTSRQQKTLQLYSETFQRHIMKHEVSIPMLNGTSHIWAKRRMCEWSALLYIKIIPSPVT